jgi:hypothetical protein
MHSFQDTAGRTWEIAVTIGAVKRVQDLLRIDLLNPLAAKILRNKAGKTKRTEPLASRLQRNPVLLIDTIFALVKPQADRLGVTDVEFGESLGGDAAYAAYEAFMAEWRDFFRSLRRETEHKAIAAGVALVMEEDRKSAAMVDRAAAATAAAADRRRDEAMRKIEARAGTPGPSATVTSSPASSDSPPSSS